MPVDISKIKAGDMVTLIPLKVKEVGVNCGINMATLIMPCGAKYITPWNGLIAAHHPAPREIVAGDRVTAVWDDRNAGTVEHVAKGKAWVIWDEGRDSVWSVSNLTLVEVV
jgi:hypothetical protein